jgi:acetyltransferase
VALKVLSREITHKSDVGGVALDLGSEAEVLEAARAMHDKVCTAAPGARIDGFVVQPMIKRPHAVELIFGAVGEAMVHLSQLIADVDEIAELDINPLLVDAAGVIALDARIVVRKPVAGQERAARLAIRPYPVELETAIQHGDEQLRIRPIRPEDEGLLQQFTRHLTPEDVRLRFFGPIREMSHEMAARLTQIDYDREMAFLLLDRKHLLGVGRLAADPGFEQAEFALVVASDRQRHGYGELLLRHVLAYAKSRGIQRVIGHVLRENRKMLHLADRVGFKREAGAAGGNDIRVVKFL